jgi:tRNA1Val (adenine37-N6)-methyltransferase
MSNTYFQYKQFIIHQQNCAMKVCTDASLFGAWIAEKAGNKELAFDRMLDIGTGTGLLSLMVAQKNAAIIDAIELDEHAAAQAADNFEESPWHERLQVIKGDARTVHLGRKYGLIISNPPFFENDLKSDDVKRNLALHSEALNLEELLGVILSHLAVDGHFAVLLPYHRGDGFIKTAGLAGLHLQEKVSVRQTPAHAFFRVMLLFGWEKSSAKDLDLTIRDGDDYSGRFTELLKDYYLKL